MAHTMHRTRTLPRPDLENLCMKTGRSVAIGTLAILPSARVAGGSSLSAFAG